MLGVADRIDPPGLGLDPAHLGQLLQRGHARLVAHIVLAVAHHLDAERRAVGGDAGREDQCDGLVLEQSRPLGHARRLRIFRRESLGQIVLDGMKADQLGAGAQQAIDLAIDVGVIDADRGETQFAHDFFVLGWQSMQGCVRCRQPFNPVVAMPSIRRRWNSRKKTNSGSSVSVDMANRAPQSDLPVESTKLRKPSCTV